jgi:hypothetical protein
MSFVHPLLLGGLLLAGLPVLVHLIMRQKPKHLPFPALRFLMQRHRTNQRKLQLRHLLLLALRMLVVALICLALARPKVFSQRFSFLGGDRPVAAVLVFDTSYSMEYSSGGRSRLEEAKRRAAELLDGFPRESRVAVLDTADQGGAAFAPLSGARERIDSLELRPANFPVTSQLGQAYELLAKLGQEEGNADEALQPVLCIFSDRTPASWDASQLANLRKLSERITPAVHSLFVDVGAERPVDLAISNLELPRQVINGNGRIIIRATVQTTGDSCDTEVVCRLDGKESGDRKPVKLEAGKSEVIAFEWRDLPQGWHQAEVAFKAADQSLPFDNVRYATFQVGGPRRVLTIADPQRYAARWRNADLWKLALEVPSAAGAFQCDVKTPAELAKASPDALRAQYQAIALLDVARPEPDLWQKLQRYVNEGGGLAVIPGGDEMRLAAYNEATARQVLPGEFLGPVRSPKEAGADWDWDGNNYQHAFMKPFREWRQDGSVDFFRLPRGAARYWDVKPDRDNATVIVRYADREHRPALLERTFDRRAVRGHVLMLTTTMDGRKSWNNYPEQLTSFYRVLAQLVAGYLTGDADDANFNYTSGQPIPVPLAPASRTPTYTLVGPDVSGADAVVQRADEQTELLLSQPVKPGNYTLYDAQGKRAACFSLNVPPDECQLSRLPVDRIEELLGPGTVLPLDRKIGLHEALQGHWDQPLELLPWLLIGLLLLLAGESFMANRFYRNEPAEQESGVQPAAYA